MTALHTLGNLSTSFMRQSPVMHFNLQVGLHLWNFFPSQCLWASNLCCDKVGVVYRRQHYLVKDQVHIKRRTAQINKRKTTVRHYLKTGRSVNAERFKNPESFFKCSRKNHQALWWNWLSWAPPQERKTQLPLLQGISSLELPASETAAQINSS